MDKTIISNRQFVIFTSGFMFGMAPLIISSSVTAIAGRDAWLSTIIATIIGLIVIGMYTTLGELYPEKTFVEIILGVLGKWIGSFVVAFYILVAFTIIPQIVWYVGDFITTQYVHELSVYPTNLLYVVVLVIGMLYGLEAMSRASEIFFIFAFSLYIITVAMLMPNVQIDNLLPIMSNSILPVIKGTIPLLSFNIFPVVFLMMVYPVNVENRREGKKTLFKGYLLGMFTVFLAVIMPVLVLGSTLTTNLRFPLFVMTKEINIGVIFSRVEAMVFIIWIVTKYISTYFIFYAGTVGLAQLLKLDDYKRIIVPLALIVFIYSGIIYENVGYQINWDKFVWTPVAFTIGLILPLILLVPFLQEAFDLRSRSESLKTILILTFILILDFNWTQNIIML